MNRGDSRLRILPLEPHCPTFCSLLLWHPCDGERQNKKLVPQLGALDKGLGLPSGQATPVKVKDAFSMQYAALDPA